MVIRKTKTPAEPKITVVEAERKANQRAFEALIIGLFVGGAIVLVVITMARYIVEAGP